MSQEHHDHAGRHQPHESAREHVKRTLDEAAQPEPDRASQQRNAGVAIAVLAGLVVVLLVAIVSGATDALQP